ncbi:MAG TPA: hypothetical protein VFH39_03685 [Candidatus Saccharimonadales bacterium]|nr:hypothetical protein [Candidatus Saccharimonadales bacterium]
METTRLNLRPLCVLGVAGLLGLLGLLQLGMATRNLTQPVAYRRRHAPRPYTFPDGGRTLFPDYRFVALYGSLQYPELGALGEQSMDQSIARAKALAARYQPLVSEHVMPAFEIIATVASDSPTEDGDYSAALNPAQIQPWITAARQNDMYVVLDLQPGRSDFLTQAKLYTSLLKLPNVGLALDPEWRLKPDQVPLAQIGSVSIDEVNRTLTWLSDLTAKGHLPQKLVVLHEFRSDMLPDRQNLDTSHANLAYVIQMDGSGPPAGKQDTWRGITANPPANVSFGWKNFYHQDTPMIDPAATMAIRPQPRYVSYQ